jgi:hypothetical protein
MFAYGNTLLMFQVTICEEHPTSGFSALVNRWLDCNTHVKSVVLVWVKDKDVSQRYEFSYEYGNYGSHTSVVVKQVGVTYDELTGVFANLRDITK